MRTHTHLASVMPKGPRAMSTSLLCNMPTIPFQEPFAAFAPHFLSGGLTYQGKWIKKSMVLMG